MSAVSNLRMMTRASRAVVAAAHEPLSTSRAAGADLARARNALSLLQRNDDTFPPAAALPTDIAHSPYFRDRLTLLLARTRCVIYDVYIGGYSWLSLVPSFSRERLFTRLLCHAIRDRLWLQSFSTHSSSIYCLLSIYLLFLRAFVYIIDAYII